MCPGEEEEEKKRDDDRTAVCLTRARNDSRERWPDTFSRQSYRLLVSRFCGKKEKGSGKSRVCSCRKTVHLLYVFHNLHHQCFGVTDIHDGRSAVISYYLTWQVIHGVICQTLSFRVVGAHTFLAFSRENTKGHLFGRLLPADGATLSFHSWPSWHYTAKEKKIKGNAAASWYCLLFSISIWLRTRHTYCNARFNKTGSGWKDTHQNNLLPPPKEVLFSSAFVC